MVQRPFVALASNDFSSESARYIFSRMRWRHGGALSLVPHMAAGRVLARAVLFPYMRKVK